MRAVSWPVVLAIAVLAATPGSRAFGAAKVGEMAPALVVQELDGKLFDLAAQRGNVVILNFWATWCPPCRKEMPVLDAFYRQYRGGGLEIIGISVDRPHDQADVRTAIQSLTYPIAMLNDASVDGFGVPDALPLTLVVDRNGVVRAKLAPNEQGVTRKDLDSVVLPLLSAK